MATGDSVVADSASQMWSDSRAVCAKPGLSVDDASRSPGPLYSQPLDSPSPTTDVLYEENDDIIPSTPEQNNTNGRKVRYGQVHRNEQLALQSTMQPIVKVSRPVVHTALMPSPKEADGQHSKECMQSPAAKKQRLQQPRPRSDSDSDHGLHVAAVSSRGSDSPYTSPPRLVTAPDGVLTILETPEANYMDDAKPTLESIGTASPASHGRISAARRLRQEFADVAAAPVAASTSTHQAYLGRSDRSCAAAGMSPVRRCCYVGSVRPSPAPGIRRRGRPPLAFVFMGSLRLLIRLPDSNLVRVRSFVADICRQYQIKSGELVNPSAISLYRVDGHLLRLDFPVLSELPEEKNCVVAVTRPSAAVGSRSGRETHVHTLACCYASLCRDAKVVMDVSVESMMKLADKHGCLMLPCVHVPSVAVSAMIVRCLDAGFCTPFLTYLNLSSSRLGDSGALLLSGVLMRLANLCSLDLSANEITIIGLGHLASPFAMDPKPLRYLELFNLSDNLFDDEDGCGELVAMMLSGMPTLYQLQMAACGLSEATFCSGGPLCEAIKNSKKLTRINLANNHLGSAGLVAIFKDTLYFSELCSLDLSGCRATAAAVGCGGSDSKQAPTLAYALHWLVQRHHAPSLTRLCLAECDIGPDEAKELQQLAVKGMPLQHLSLRGNPRLRAASLRDLLVALERLNSLDISWCPLSGDVGYGAVANAFAADLTDLFKALEEKVGSKPQSLRYLTLGPAHWCRRALAARGHIGSLVRAWKARWTFAADCCWLGCGQLKLDVTAAEDMTALLPFL